MSRHRAMLPPNSKLDKKVLIRLLKYTVKNYKIQTVIVIISIFISAIISVVSSIFMKSLIDDYIAPLILSSNPNFKPLQDALIFIGTIYLIGTLFNFLFQKLLVYITQGTTKKIRDDLFEKMERLPIKYFDTHPHGEIMSVYTNDIDTLRQVISQSLPQFLSSLISIISVFISMLVLSFPLTLIVVFMVIIMQIVVKNLMVKSGSYFIKQQNDLAKENGFIEEMMEGVKVIKVFTYEDKAIERFKEINDNLFDSSYNANQFANMLFPILGNIGNISYVLTAFIGGLIAIKFNAMSVGTLASFLTLNRSFNMPIMQVSQQMNSVIMAMAGAQRIFNLMDEDSEIDDGKVTLVNYDEETNSISESFTGKWAWKHPHDDKFNLVPLKGDVKFNNVSFGYNDNKIVLHDVDLYAEPGQKIAFVGATGAGKTTIMNLINRFYDVQKGSITYDGIDVKLIKKDDLRKSLGIVLQDTHLFSGTIKENIKYANQNATDDEVIKAAKLANAHQFIKHLENGYDTHLSSDGSPLSQGQKQLISIARAALANSPVLILDEATSSIDSRTEKIVQDGMDKLMANRTTFVIAHRLSTIKNSNAIMVMDKGQIIERGNHKSLLDKKGRYYELYTGAIEID
ncbi:MAG: ABC transporter ATP-binding protein/permease [Erysipelotrichaceae bacterium]|nr:ABC transporter ATP-binding protein/permease [Erysipelotrichaceae bacterium]